MIGKIHRFFNIYVHDNHSQTWRVNRTGKEKIGHLQVWRKKKKSDKGVYKIFNCRVSGTISVLIYIGTEGSV